MQADPSGASFCKPIRVPTRSGFKTDLIQERGMSVTGVQEPIGAVTDAALREKSRHGNNSDDDKAKRQRD